MRLQIFIGCLSFGFLASPTFAAVKTLTWKDTVNLAIQNNPDLRSSEETLNSSRFLEGSSFSGFLPSLYGSVLGFRNGTSTAGVASTDSYTAQLNLSQNIFAGFGDYYRYKQSQAVTRASIAAVQGAKAQLSLDLKQAYEGMIYAQDARKLGFRILDRRKDNLKIVQLRFQSGLENKGAVMLAQAYFEEAKLADQQLMHQQEVARSTLNKVLGQLDATEIDVEEPLPMQMPPPKPSFEALLENTPDVLQARAKQTAAESDVGIKRSPFFPSLDLSGTYGRTDTTFFPNTDNKWSLGLTLTIPLFSGFRDYSETRASSARSIATQADRMSTESKTMIKLHQTFEAYVDTVEKARVDEVFRRALEVRAEIARSKYNNGLMSFDDWDKVENDLIDREQKAVASARDRVNSEAAWEQAQGIGVIP